MNENIIQIGGIPFSKFIRKNKSQSFAKLSSKKLSKKLSKRISKRKSKRKSKRRTLSKRKSKRNLTKSFITVASHSTYINKNCNCFLVTKSKSPEGLGYCSKCIPTNIIMKGKNGKLWENKNKKWIQLIL